MSYFIIMALKSAYALLTMNNIT